MKIDVRVRYAWHERKAQKMKCDTYGKLLKPISGTLSFLAIDC